MNTFTKMVAALLVGFKVTLNLRQISRQNRAVMFLVNKIPSHVSLAPPILAAFPPYIGGFDLIINDFFGGPTSRPSIKILAV